MVLFRSYPIPEVEKCFQKQDSKSLNIDSGGSEAEDGTNQLKRGQYHHKSSNNALFFPENYIFFK